MIADGWLRELAAKRRDSKRALSLSWVSARLHKHILPGLCVYIRIYRAPLFRLERLRALPICLFVVFASQLAGSAESVISQIWKGGNLEQHQISEMPAESGVLSPSGCECCATSSKVSLPCCRNATISKRRVHRQLSNCENATFDITRVLYKLSPDIYFTKITPLVSFNSRTDRFRPWRWQIITVGKSYVN